MASTFPKILNTVSKLFQPITAVQKNMQIKYQDITSKSQRLMLEIGIIKQANPGSYHLLPLGVRAFEKLTKIVDEEMHLIDAQKIIFPTLINAKLWERSGRLEDVESELFKLKDRHKMMYILSPTHEETVADLIASIGPLSYKSFPLRLYQITSKYRDEIKPRFGLMRGRQFFMKDLYCFDTNLENAAKSYEIVCEAYDSIFNKLEMNYVKGTTGNMGGTISHEYHFISEIGEDKILQCQNCGYSANMELVQNKKCPKCSSEKVEINNGIEVGHTFLLGDKYSKVLNANYLGENNKPVTLEMGSYGLGLTRMLAAVIEVLSLEHEIRWPKVIAPYNIIIIPPKAGSKEAQRIQGIPEEIYHSLNLFPVYHNNILYDDRDFMTIGRRVLDAKRTGYPFIIVAGNKVHENPPLYEVIDVANNTQLFLTKEELFDFFQKDQKIQYES